MVEKAREGSENAVASLGEQGIINNIFSSEKNHAPLDILANDAYLNQLKI